MRGPLATLLAGALWAGVAGADPAELARGAQLLAPFKQQLQQALKEGLARGPVEAVSSCQMQAPLVAQEASRDGVRVGRTSHRLRNPANTAPGWVEPILAAYRARAEPGSDALVPRSVVLPDGRRGYVEPILIQPQCLTCHGDALAPAVAARIAELYPEDRAVGFETAELRGVFWIEYPQ